MIETLKENPHIRCDEARIKVVKKYEALNKDDLPKWDNVVTELGSKQSTTRNLRRVRKYAMGKKISNRDDFEPESYLKTMEGGEKVIVIDSKRLGKIFE